MSLKRAIQSVGYMLISCHSDFSHMYSVRVGWLLTSLYFAPVDYTSRLSGCVKLTLRYNTMLDIRCRHRRYECDGGIRFYVPLVTK